MPGLHLCASHKLKRIKIALETTIKFQLNISLYISKKLRPEQTADK